jgi:hypothetical protein
MSASRCSEIVIVLAQRFYGRLSEEFSEGS